MTKSGLPVSSLSSKLSPINLLVITVSWSYAELDVISATNSPFFSVTVTTTSLLSKSYQIKGLEFSLSKSSWTVNLNTPGLVKFISSTLASANSLSGNISTNLSKSETPISTYFGSVIVPFGFSSFGTNSNLNFVSNSIILLYASSFVAFTGSINFASGIWTVTGFALYVFVMVGLFPSIF